MQIYITIEEYSRGEEQDDDQQKMEKIEGKRKNAGENHTGRQIRKFVLDAEFHI